MRAKGLPVRLSNPAGGSNRFPAAGRCRPEGLKGQHGAALSPSLLTAAASADRTRISDGTASYHNGGCDSMCTEPPALGPSANRARELRRIHVHFRLGLALLVGVWLSIAGFVVLALWMKWRL